MKYVEIMWAERRVDCYGGESCDQHEAEWQTQAQGDMDHDATKRPLVLEANSFPPGTKISIEIPVCPECSQDIQLCSASPDCDFDWKQWAEDKYA